MRKTIKFVAVLFMLCLFSQAVYASEAAPVQEPEQKQAYFLSCTGTVVSIEEFEDHQSLLVEDEEGLPTVIIIDNNTVMISEGGQRAENGDRVTAFYEANAPAILIYPPQYRAESIAVNLPENQNIMADRFDENLVSYGNTLKLNISETTEIISNDGSPFQGGTADLANRKLVVIYDVSTRSIPAQTNPLMIVVLKEKATPPIASVGDIQNGGNLELVVNNMRIEAPEVILGEGGVVMVPVRAVAESLGFEVFWNHELKQVTVGVGITLTPGEDNYCYTEGGAVQLGAAPVLSGDRVYVPLSFFKDVMHLSNAYVFEGQIVIDDNAIMG